MTSLLLEQPTGEQRRWSRYPRVALLIAIVTLPLLLDGSVRGRAEFDYGSIDATLEYARWSQGESLEL